VELHRAPDAEATNNRAERAIRHAVLWRNSIRETCRLNQQPLHACLVDIRDARLTGPADPQPPPAAQHAPELSHTQTYGGTWTYAQSSLTNSIRR